MTSFRLVLALTVCLALLLTPRPVRAQAPPVAESVLPTPAALAPPPALPLLDQSATLALKVPSYENARTAVLDAARARGALLWDARTRVNEKGKKHGWLRLSVRASDLPLLLADLHSLGALYAENVATTDQLSTSEELQRRVERLQQHEQRLEGILQSDRRMRGSDLLFLQERLFRASVDESLLSQQRVDLERSARAGTLLVELFEPGALPPGAPQPVSLTHWYAGAVSIAHAGRDRTLARAATASAYAVVYAPFWVPLLLIAALLLALLWRQRRVIGQRLMSVAVAAAAGLVRLDAWLRALWQARHAPLDLPSRGE